MKIERKRYPKRPRAWYGNIRLTRPHSALTVVVATPADLTALAGVGPTPTAAILDMRFQYVQTKKGGRW